MSILNHSTPVVITVYYMHKCIFFITLPILSTTIIYGFFSKQFLKIFYIFFLLKSLKPQPRMSVLFSLVYRLPSGHVYLSDIRTSTIYVYVRCTRAVACVFPRLDFEPAARGRVIAGRFVTERVGRPTPRRVPRDLSSRTYPCTRTPAMMDRRPRGCRRRSLSRARTSCT